MPPQSLRADTMARRAGCESVYDAAQRWVDAALRKDDSLFTPAIRSGRFRTSPNSTSALLASPRSLAIALPRNSSGS